MRFFQPLFIVAHLTLASIPRLGAQVTTDHPAPPAVAAAALPSNHGPATLTVALLQIVPENNNVTANMAKAEQFCRRAAGMGADVALMPELWSVGYTRFDPKEPGGRESFQAKALRKGSDAIQHFGALAKELNMAIGVTYLEAHFPAPRDSITLFDRHGTEILTYAKIHMCDFTAMEAAMDPGDDFQVGDLDAKAGKVRIGAMICFDREQPESARVLMIKGAEIVLTPNACDLDSLRLDQFKTRAWENAIGLAMANYPKPMLNGHSIAFDAEGSCLGKSGEDEDVLLVRFDLNQLRARRHSTVWANAYRRPQRYSLLISPDKDDIWTRTNKDGTVFDASKR